MANVPLSELRAAIETADYPATKEALVSLADERGASEAARKALRSLPPVEYSSFDEVVRSVTPEVGSGPTEAQRSDPRNRPGKPGVAERFG